MLSFQVPPSLRFWLKDRYSLTHRLTHLFSGQISLSLLQHQWERPTKEEAGLLRIPNRRLCLVREVILSHTKDNKAVPVVFGRSVIPATTMIGKNRLLLDWGEDSIGTFLFSDPTLKRTCPQPICLTTGDALYHKVLHQNKHSPTIVWGRRSIFKVRGKPLLVFEFFLPDFFTYKGASLSHTGPAAGVTLPCSPSAARGQRTRLRRHPQAQEKRPFGSIQ